MHPEVEPFYYGTDYRCYVHVPCSGDLSLQVAPVQLRLVTEHCKLEYDLVYIGLESTKWYYQFTQYHRLESQPPYGGPCHVTVDLLPALY